jgi:hypothetical protein
VLTGHRVRQLAAKVVGLCLLVGGGLVTACSSADNPPAAGTPKTPAATATPTLAPLKPMRQPTKPFQVTQFPKETGSTELDSIRYGLKKVTWVSLGAIPSSTRSSCTVGNADLVAIKEKASKSFSCSVVTGRKRTTGKGKSKRTVVVDRTATRFGVRATRRGSRIDWTYTARRLPVSQAKIEHEMVRQAHDPARVTCLVRGTVLLRVGDPDPVRCFVTHPDNSQTTYFGGLDTKGALTFATATELQHRKLKR